MILEFVTLSIGFLRSGISLWLRTGLHGVAPQIDQRNLPEVSVVIAAHNEEENLERCLQAVTAQRYPGDKVEIVLVNDRSADRTAEIMAKWAERDPRLQILSIDQVPEGYPPKKFALLQGIERSRHEILCFTDADCVPRPGWLRALAQAYNGSTAMVIGMTVLRPPQNSPLLLWQRLRIYESWANGFLAIASAGLGFPLTCGGGSLSYRKSAFKEAGGFDSIRHSLSGDDDLLMHRFRQKKTGKIRSVLAPDALVETDAPRKFAELFRQKARHYSASRYYPPYAKAFYLVFHGSHIFLLAAALGAVFLPARMAVAALLAFGLVLVAEGAYHQKGFSLLGGEFPAKEFILFELLQPFFLLLFGIWGWLRTPRWKESA